MLFGNKLGSRNNKVINMKRESGFTHDQMYYPLTSLSPRRLKELHFGCFKCNGKNRTWDELVKAFPEKHLETSNRFDPFLCDQPGHDASIVPWCPVTGGYVTADDRFHPMGLTGSKNAGKTVYLAVLYRQVMDKFHMLTGATASFNDFGNCDFVLEIVEQLFRKGKLPKKTQEDKYHKVSITVQNQRDARWVRRRFTATDMAGEIYKYVNPRDASEEMHDYYLHMIRARESIFMASPEESNGLGAIITGINRDFTPLACEIGASEGVQGSLLNGDFEEIDVQNFAEQMTSVLQRCAGEIEYGDEKLVSEKICALINAPQLMPEVASVISENRGRFRPSYTFDAQLKEIANFMRGNSYPETQDGRLKHRVAVTISKADMLPDIWRELDYENLLESYRVSIESKASIGSWRKATQACSNRSKEVLRRYEEAFVDWAEDNFEDVGFFFVSALGCRTEPVVKLKDIARGQAIPNTAFNPAGSLTNAVSPEQPLNTPMREWDFEPMVAREGGIREPTPRNVLLPFLWQVTSSPII